MSKAKYTPGPWMLVTDEEDVYFIGCGLPFIEVSEKKYVKVERMTEEEAIANATLIAAAPELLEALEKAQEDINWMLNNKQQLNGFVFDYIEKAIAKAKGNT